MQAAESGVREVEPHLAEDRATPMDASVHRGVRLAPLSARVSRLWTVFALHQAIASSAARNPVMVLAPRLSEWSARLDALKSPTLDSWSAEVLAAGLEKELDALESDVLDADARVRGASFRRALERVALDDATIVAYLSLLARRAGSTTVQRDRYLALASRLLFVTGDAGGRLLSFEDALPLLEEISGGCRAPDDLRLDATRFFHEAMQRVHRITSWEDAVTSGIVIDLVGFELTLGGEIADPEILHGVVALDAALSQHASELCRLEGRGEGEPAWLAWKVGLRMRRTFATTVLFDRPEAPKFGRIDWRRQKWRLGLIDRLKPERESIVRPRRRTLLVALLTAALGLLAAHVVGLHGLRHENSVEASSDAELMSISSVLVEGGVSSGASSAVFLGRLDDEAWSRRTPGERHAEAEQIAATLAARGIRAAMLRVGDEVVVQIQDGNVRYVGGP